MINLSNDEALKCLREHQQFKNFLENFREDNYQGVTLEQAYTFISTGVLVEGMALDSSLKLMHDIKHWVSRHSHGGKRKHAGRKPLGKEIKKITLSAEDVDIKLAKKTAEAKGKSLQSEFRQWLKKYAGKASTK